MKKFIIASVLASTLSGCVGTSTDISQFTPISKTIIGDSYTAYEASKVCAKELFFVPSKDHQFIYLFDETQSWALSFHSDVALSTGVKRFTARLSTNVEDEKIHVTIDSPLLVGENEKDTSEILNDKYEAELLEDKLYDAYESFMMCLSDY